MNTGNITYNKQDYTFNKETNRYESTNNNGSYIASNYRVYDCNDNLTGQYYPPLAAAPNISWGLVVVVIGAAFYYIFKQ